MNAISLKNVSFVYKTGGDVGDVTALKNVDLDIEEGAFVALVGHNGSGKSTLAKLLNGLLAPTEGSVEIFGVDTSDVKRTFDVRKSVGMVFQNPDNQMIASVVEDDIAFGPENLGVPRAEIIERVDWALAKVGMSEHKKGTPFKMSGGQKQRLAIAGVLAMLPRILVLDESTAMLDPKGRAEVMKVAHELNAAEGMTVVHITHYMDEAVGADRVLVMNAGEIAMDGAPREIFSRADELRGMKLSVPIVTSMAVRLRAAGLDIRGDILDEKELEDELCRLLSKD